MSGTAQQKLLAKARKWWGGSPFTAPAAQAERTTAVIAAGALHPDDEIREACRSCIAEHVGAANMIGAVDTIRFTLDAHSRDPIEPLVLEEGDIWAIAAIQRLRGNSEFSRELRVTSMDSLDLTGGVRLLGLSEARRLPRRRADGSWNYPAGPAFHPQSLREWIARATQSLRCQVTLQSAEEGALIRVPFEESGLGALIEELHAATVDRADIEGQLWFFGGALVTVPIGDGGLESVVAKAAVAASLQHHARLLPADVTLTSIGCIAQVGSAGAELRFRRPEAVIRLLAATCTPGLIELSAIRPWGWLLLGRGGDAIDFIRSAHAVPPHWARVPEIATLDPSPRVLDAIARWVGPCVGPCQGRLSHATLEALG